MPITLNNSIFTHPLHSRKNKNNNASDPISTNNQPSTNSNLNNVNAFYANKHSIYFKGFEQKQAINILKEILLESTSRSNLESNLSKLKKAFDSNKDTQKSILKSLRESLVNKSNECKSISMKQSSIGDSIDTIKQKKLKEILQLNVEESGTPELLNSLKTTRDQIKQLKSQVSLQNESQIKDLQIKKLKTQIALLPDLRKYEKMLNNYNSTYSINGYDQGYNKKAMNLHKKTNEFIDKIIKQEPKLIGPSTLDTVLNISLNTDIAYNNKHKNLKVIISHRSDLINGKQKEKLVDLLENNPRETFSYIDLYTLLSNKKPSLLTKKMFYNIFYININAGSKVQDKNLVSYTLANISRHNPDLVKNELNETIRNLNRTDINPLLRYDFDAVAKLKALHYKFKLTKKLGLSEEQTNKILQSFNIDSYKQPSALMLKDDSNLRNAFKIDKKLYKTELEKFIKSEKQRARIQVKKEVMAVIEPSKTALLTEEKPAFPIAIPIAGTDLQNNQLSPFVQLEIHPLVQAISPSDREILFKKTHELEDKLKFIPDSQEKNKIHEQFHDYLDSYYNIHEDRRVNKRFLDSLDPSYKIHHRLSKKQRQKLETDFNNIIASCDELK